MGEEPPIYVFDFSNAPGATEFRERLRRARTEARRRYRDHLAAVFDLHGSADPRELADGTAPVDRAKFIVDTIRVHLARATCTLHPEDLSSFEALLGREVRWCPSCGTRLSSD